MYLVFMVAFPVVGCILLNAANDAMKAGNMPLACGLGAVGIFLIAAFGKEILSKQD